MAKAQHATRESILQAARELFASNGYHATGVQELSVRAGVGRGALYHHIRSKEDLLYELSMDLMVESVDRAQQIVESDRSAEDRLREFIHGHIKGVTDNRPTWVIVMYESRALEKERRRLIYETRDQYESLWAQLLDAVALDLKVPQASQVIRRGLLGMLNNTHLWLEPSGPIDTESVADEYHNFIVSALASQSPGGR